MQLPYTLLNHPSLLGVIRLPWTSHTERNLQIPFIINKNNKWYSGTQIVKTADRLTGIKLNDAPFTVPKNEITDFYPYTYYVLTDGETDPLIMYPQYMPSSCKLVGKFALSHQPVERFYIEGYKGDNTGRVYNITNTNGMTLPTATNEGLNNIIANANTNKQTNTNNFVSTVLSGVSGAVSGFATGGVIGGVAGGLTGSANGLMNIQSNNARNKDIMLTPNSISSWGNPSTRDKFGNNEVRVLKYTIQDKYKEKIKAYTKRYGYKYNNYKKIDIKKYKGFIKFGSVDLDGGIEFEYLNKIKNILERGVYIE